MARGWDNGNYYCIFDPVEFSYDVTSNIDSSGPRALEEIFNLTVLQAI